MWCAATALASLLLGTAALAAEAPPAWLEEAIRLGSTKAKLEPYAAPGLPVTYTTPFLRVARATNKAFREGRTLRPADVEAKSWVPELRILIGALPVPQGSGPPALADPRSVRLTLGPGEVKPSRMDHSVAEQSFSVDGGPPRTVSGGLLKAVFEVRGAPPAGGELEIRYAWAHDGRQEEIVKHVPLDFRRERW